MEHPTTRVTPKLPRSPAVLGLASSIFAAGCGVALFTLSEAVPAAIAFVLSATVGAASWTSLWAFRGVSDPDR